MLVLGIETSCDDTSAALVRDGGLVSMAVSTQDAVHAPFGGVVPEVAAREHLTNLPRVVDHVLAEAGVAFAEVQGVAVTSGPGLVGSLLVGVMAAKGLALALDKPWVGVNHLRAHLMANALQDRDFEPPYLGLVVSGGHTSVVVVHEGFRVEVLGETRDDAAGEVLDKVGRVLGLGYPAGRWVEQEAALGDPAAVPLAAGMLRDKTTLDFSFSGLKTAAVLRWREGEVSRADLCAALQAAVIEALAQKVESALARTRLKRLALAGGVVANKALAARLTEVAAAFGARVHVPPPRFCTDNAAMVAVLGETLLAAGRRSAMDLNAVASLGWDDPEG